MNMLLGIDSLLSDHVLQPTSPATCAAFAPVMYVTINLHAFANSKVSHIGHDQGQDTMQGANMGALLKQAVMDKVKADKLREVTDGHDGTWIAHPGLLKIAKQV